MRVLHINHRTRSFNQHIRESTIKTMSMMTMTAGNIIYYLYWDAGVFYIYNIHIFHAFTRPSSLSLLCCVDVVASLPVRHALFKTKTFKHWKGREKIRGFRVHCLFFEATKKHFFFFTLLCTHTQRTDTLIRMQIMW